MDELDRLHKFVKPLMPSSYKGGSGKGTAVNDPFQRGGGVAAGGGFGDADNNGAEGRGAGGGEAMRDLIEEETKERYRQMMFMENQAEALKADLKAEQAQSRTGEVSS